MGPVQHPPEFRGCNGITVRIDGLETHGDVVVGVGSLVADRQVEHVGGTVEHGDGWRGHGHPGILAVGGRDDGVPCFAFGRGRGGEGKGGVSGLDGAVFVPCNGRSTFAVAVVVRVGVGHRQVVGGVGGGWRDEDVTGHRVGVAGDLFADAGGEGVVVVSAGAAVAVA